MNTILAPVAGEVSALEPLLVHYLLTPNEPTNQIISHIFSAGGKRIRPSVFLLVCKLLNYSGEHKFPIAGVCEYIHTASLLHDDVIDNSTVRRNKPTANAVWGDESAVLAGDLIYSAACRLMVKTASLDLIDCFAECIRFMSESELFQLELIWNLDTTVEDYLRVVHGKTATLFKACALTPGYLVKADEFLLNKLAAYGESLGFAFQIADDCLDYDGTTAEVGKKLFSDLAEGKVTLPLILSMQKNTPDSLKLKNLLSQIFASPGTLNPDLQTEIIRLIHVTGGLSEARKKAQEYAFIAENSLQEIYLKLGHSETSEAPKNALSKLSAFVIERNK